MSESPRELLDRMYEAWNRYDIEGGLAMAGIDP